MALRATKGSEDARGSGAGALAGPPAAGRQRLASSTSSTERSPTPRAVVMLQYLQQLDHLHPCASVSICGSVLFALAECSEGG
jgi:hypothetical protein